MTLASCKPYVADRHLLKGDPIDQMSRKSGIDPPPAESQCNNYLETFMNTFRCPYLDRLGQELLESYRRVKDYELYCRVHGMELPTQIARIHHAISDHRKSCLLCQEIAHVMEIEGIAACHHHPGIESSTLGIQQHGYEFRFNRVEASN